MSWEKCICKPNEKAEVKANEIDICYSSQTCFINGENVQCAQIITPMNHYKFETCVCIDPSKQGRKYDDFESTDKETCYGGEYCLIDVKRIKCVKEAILDTECK